jgi:thiamine kinase-like enzyme
VIEGLDDVLADSGQLGLAELRACLQEVLGGSEDGGRLVEQQPLKARKVHRLRFEVGGRLRSVVVKRLRPTVAQRNHFVHTRWLPAMGLGESAPALLGVAAERGGRFVWHVSEDVGDWPLDRHHPEPRWVEAAVELIGQLHVRSAEHPLLAECRRYAEDLGIYYYMANVRDAVRGLEALRSADVGWSSERLALWERLLGRLQKLLGEASQRARLLEEAGGPDVLLHGDLWTTNTFVGPAPNGLQAQLIDWDHAGVGPTSYDLSTFLYRFRREDRPWILDSYRRAVGRAGWRLPPARDLNVLFETAECARYAGRAIWPAVALLQDRAEWGFAELAEVDRWFEALEPAIPEQESRTGWEAGFADLGRSEPAVGEALAERQIQLISSYRDPGALPEHPPTQEG